MPTNLPPQCRTLQRRYLEAETLPEKIRALEEFHAAIPKHKGTERMRAQLKRKLSKFRLDMEKKKHAGSQTAGRYAIKRAGAAQVVIIGPINSGRSSLLKTLTNAEPETSEYPFTTTEPIPGMMLFDDVQIQLVEAPALFEGGSEGRGWGLKTLSLARNADGLILLIDLSKPNPKAQLEMIVDELKKARVHIGQRQSRVEIERKESGGIQFLCTSSFVGSLEEIRRFLMENGVNNAIIRIYGDVDLDEVALSLVSGVVYKPAIVVANKLDTKGAPEKLKRLTSEVDLSFHVIGTSTRTKIGLKEIPKSIFTILNLVRIYTKRPRQKPTMKPMIMRGKTSVEDVAKLVHSDLYKRIKYAKIWGSSKFPGEKVGSKYRLKDGDIVEIHV
ncbi:MAG: 50S ribosome-binding GTPase [Candidatus Bathyarchaeota archaeon]|nr:MAG: 50S ribosome-binding GTPase [Candidatus Bathyarchaeota archaeon]